MKHGIRHSRWSFIQNKSHARLRSICAFKNKTQTKETFCRKLRIKNLCMLMKASRCYANRQFSGSRVRVGCFSVFFVIASICKSNLNFPRFFSRDGYNCMNSWITWMPPMEILVQWSLKDNVASCNYSNSFPQALLTVLWLHGPWNWIELFKKYILLIPKI